jgi:hypothetical protein
MDRETIAIYGAALAAGIFTSVNGHIEIAHLAFLSTIGAIVIAYDVAQRADEALRNRYTPKEKDNA